MDNLWCLPPHFCSLRSRTSSHLPHLDATVWKGGQAAQSLGDQVTVIGGSSQSYHQNQLEGSQNTVQYYMDFLKGAESLRVIYETTTKTERRNEGSWSRCLAPLHSCTWRSWRSSLLDANNNRNLYFPLLCYTYNLRSYTWQVSALSLSYTPRQ